LKVVLDTNVLVAALLKKGKAYRLLQHGLRNDRFDILSAPEQLAELKRVLRQKFSGVLSKSEVGTFVNLFKEAAIVVRPQKGVNLSSDPDDNLILGIALAGGADFIVNPSCYPSIFWAMRPRLWARTKESTLMTKPSWVTA
jgi:putative PIN family toxin of toxin-antitoxin system